MPFFPAVQKFTNTQDEAIDVSNKNNVEEEHYKH